MVGLSLSIPGLLDAGFRNPPSCLIEAGVDRRDIGAVAPLVASVDIQTSLEEAASGTIVIEDRRGSDGKWVAADSGLFGRWTPIRVSADFGAHQDVILAGYILKLTPEYPGNAAEAKLTLEVQDESAALSREQILSAVWGYDFDPGTNVLSVYVNYLRRKLEVDGEPAPIETVRAAGIRLVGPRV